jgi:hypothetical protein
VLLLVGGVFTALLIPQITRQWQDRQSEHATKQSLLEEISTSASTAIRQGISLAAACEKPPPALDKKKPSSALDKNKEPEAVCAPLPPTSQIRAAGGMAGESIPEVYELLRNSWLIRRSVARSRITTYFPKLYSCWYSYERALSDYLGLVTQGLAIKKKRVELLHDYVGSDLSRVYTEPSVVDENCRPLGDLPVVVQERYGELKGRMGWKALTYPTWHYRFNQEYAKLGELLDIAMERIVFTIVRAHAEGFSHGVHVPGF